MITTKQRAYLRGLANDLPALYQLGKNGITEEFIASLDEALDKKELIKVSVLKNVFMSTREAMDAICEELNCDPVSCIGSKMVFYRRAKEEKNIKIIL